MLSGTGTGLQTGPSLKLRCEIRMCEGLGEGGSELVPFWKGLRGKGVKRLCGEGAALSPGSLGVWGWSPVRVVEEM